jgi:hypothetical protein
LRRLRFFVARAAVRRRSAYRPVRRWAGVHHLVSYYINTFVPQFSCRLFYVSIIR